MNKRFLPLTILSALLLIAVVSDAQTTTKEKATSNPKIGEKNVVAPSSEKVSTPVSGAYNSVKEAYLHEQQLAKPKVENKSTTVSTTPSNSTKVRAVKQNTKETSKK